MNSLDELPLPPPLRWEVIHLQRSRLSPLLLSPHLCFSSAVWMWFVIPVWHCRQIGGDCCHQREGPGRGEREVQRPLKLKAHGFHGWYSLLLFRSYHKIAAYRLQIRGLTVTYVVFQCLLICFQIKDSDADGSKRIQGTFWQVRHWYTMR